MVLTVADVGIANRSLCYLFTGFELVHKKGRSLYIFKMTNISNLNLSKGTIPPLLKYKIVFLGDQAVGKSSIINRFIYDIFDGNEHVLLFSCRGRPLESISSRKTYS